MTYLGIELNNYAVRELQSGNLSQAFELLSYACEKTLKRNRHAHVDSSEETYRYVWADCSTSLTKRLHCDDRFNEGCMPFLCLKFLTVETPLGRASVECLCPCGFAWVLYYNLAIVSALLGSPVGATGHQLLRQSLQLFEQVQCRVDPEPLSNKHWSTLQLSIWNNQACVLSDLAMDDQQILERLVKMGLRLTKSCGIIDPSDQELFHWTVQKLVEEKFAAAA